MSELDYANLPLWLIAGSWALDRVIAIVRWRTDAARKDATTKQTEALEDVEDELESTAAALRARLDEMEKDILAQLHHTRESIVNSVHFLRRDVGRKVDNVSERIDHLHDREREG
jgi:phosphoglycerate-specific signal transduction histidine kinase